MAHGGGSPGISATIREAGNRGWRHKGPRRRHAKIFCVSIWERGFSRLRTRSGRIRHSQTIRWGCPRIDRWHPRTSLYSRPRHTPGRRGRGLELPRRNLGRFPGSSRTNDGRKCSRMQIALVSYTTRGMDIAPKHVFMPTHAGVPGSGARRGSAGRTYDAMIRSR